ncbi:uncharacterized protein cubi_01413 [Cryptosporidium ubiquitum]|uniref:Uncharacterized protein n=1 Tax=Cryptosporidium ubiquitum TaxID=857276 RepID=A0A1J4MCW5_9CRYT|nr:uncharacterized protein cubi_01413 [Cryptosporidium ubiquitum]OII72080.1 hypothetical protein cubi_01413 [Cryptosporidium ubiquitum]
MFKVENEENPIFPFIEILIKKNQNQYSLNSTRTNSIARMFIGVSPGILLSLLKNIGENIMELNSKLESNSYTANIQNMLYFVSKDIVTVKYPGLPEIFLARYFFQFDKSYMVLCNCCYKDLYKSKLNTFDLVFYIQNQNFWYTKGNEDCSKITLISRSSGNIVTSKCINTLSSILTNYGVFFIIYSLFTRLANMIVAIKRYLRIAVTEELEIEELFINNFLSSLDVKICKEVI